jgi:hypothetical protein
VMAGEKGLRRHKTIFIVPVYLLYRDRLIRTEKQGVETPFKTHLFDGKLVSLQTLFITSVNA